MGELPPVDQMVLTSAHTVFHDYVFGRRRDTNGADDTNAPSDLSHIFSPPVRRNSPFGLLHVTLPRLEKGAIQHEMIVAYLYQQQRSRFWISDDGHIEEGAFMRETWSDYITCPVALQDSSLAEAIVDLNAEIVITLKSKIVEAFFRLKNNTGRVHLRSGLQIQMLPSLRDLKLAQKHQCAAFIQEECYLLVWDDDPNKLIERAADLENQLVEISWRSATGVYPKGGKRRLSNATRNREETLELAGGEKRHHTYINSIICALTLTLSCLVIGLGLKVLAQEIIVDHNYRRLTVLLFIPVQFFMSLFFMQVVVVCAFQLLGPVGQYRSNTKYYFGKPPSRITGDNFLPHVTIQCPIFTEGLGAVVEPTLMSLKGAVSTYEMQGGSTNIFVNDDGMLSGLMSSPEIELRKQFYKKHNIGWIARPAHNPNPTDGSPRFLRRGRFKKASNMNFALMLSTKVEENLAVVHRDADWSQEDETKEYERCLEKVLCEIERKAWAGGDIRIGDYVLLVDSDTRIPDDCLLDAVSEMEQSPDVGILQYTAGVLHVSEDFFESGISYFTDLIYTAIGYMVSNGDVAPFVGHNALIRWQAMQDVAYYDEDNVVKFWSECSVSEDFDMSLRLQFENWIIRFASYTREGFKEGVSLTIYDELSRWEKYAYGCSELVFHPFIDWPSKGPFTKVIRDFIWSATPIASKLSILGYIGSCYAIGSAWIFSLLNYFLIGWAEGTIDRWYLQSFDIFIGLLFVFSFACNISLALLMYRTRTKKLLTSLIENFMWVLLFCILFGGLSLSVSRVLLCHLFSINISWSTTHKEVENLNFFQEAPRILRKCKYRFLYCICGLALILVFAFALPHQWRITQFVAIFPLALSVGTHFLLPIALNPALMRFNW